MPDLIRDPAFIPAANGKLIEEYVGLINSGTAVASLAHMHSPEGWSEPGQTPEFDEFTLVLKGLLRVEHNGGITDVEAGQALIAHKGEWVRYSTPAPGGAEYIAVRVPAFTPSAAHRDSSD
jgi:ethanolamine utilization protein EutQ